MKWCLYFHSFPKKIKQRSWNLSSEDQNKKNAELDWQETANVDTGCGWVTRWRGGENCKSLDICNRKLA